MPHFFCPSVFVLTKKISHVKVNFVVDQLKNVPVIIVAKNVTRHLYEIFCNKDMTPCESIVQFYL